MNNHHGLALCLRRGAPLTTSRQPQNHLIILEIHRAHDLAAVPFSVPEAWDAWLSFVDEILCFCQYITLALETGVSSEEAHLAIGHAVVHTRFVVHKLFEIEQLEDNVFDI